MMKAYPMKRTILLLLSGLWLLLSPAQAEDRLYFTGMVENNPDLGIHQVILEWGPLEQSIPGDITGFRLYRRQGAAVFQLIEETERGVADVVTIQGLFEEPGEALRRDNIQKWAESASGGAATGNAAYAYVHDILSLTPGHEDYNPIRTIFLMRMNANVSRALGMGSIDRTALPAGNYEYMLTGMIGSTETLPLGKTVVDTSVVDVLPAPASFEQVFVGGCSAIGRGLDDRRIHFRWDVPVSPDRLRQKILTFGYDLYRSDSDLGLGPDALRNMQLAGSFNPALTKVNKTPVIVAGQAPTEGRDAFLTIDEGDVANFIFLERGRVYYYYLVAIDLSGKYSRTSPVVEAMVPDSMPPPAPWAVRTEEIKDPIVPTTPRIQLVWDEINSTNYLNQYGSRRTFVTPPAYAAPSELYYVPDSDPVLPRNYREVDLDVEKYLVFRFASQEGAQKWGTDSDLDFWPDEIEDASGTDKCDEASHPAGNPPELVAQIPITDAPSLRTLSNGQKQRVFIDTVPSPDNHVFWYRMIAVDQFGNQSPLSPPVRGVLWDRTQPTPAAGVKVERCRYVVIRDDQCENRRGVRIYATDETKNQKAASVCLFEVCPQRETPGGKPGNNYVLLLEKEIRDRFAEIRNNELQRFCESICQDRGIQNRMFILRYYDSRGRLLGSSETFSIVLCSDGTVCFRLTEVCKDSVNNPGETLDPNEPINVCVRLNPGERARVFYEINGKMSAISTIHAPTDAAGLQIYCVTEDLTAIVPAGACLGVRVFSKNNVGSYLKYLNCLTIPTAEPPDPPLMHSVDPAGTQAAPKFLVRWTSQSEGLSAFVLSRSRNGDVEYDTYWINGNDLVYKNGLYEVSIALNPATDLNQEWCFRVRAIDKALRSSKWSESLCDTWEQEPGDHLTWPPVPETPKGTGIIAYFLNVPFYPQPILVLSDDLTTKLYLDKRCQFTVPECRQTHEKPCLEEVPFSCTGICDQLKAANQFGKFIVYRQEEGKDFVQVSPLIDTFWCYRTDSRDPLGLIVSTETLDDPYIYLAGPMPAFIQPPAIRPQVDGLRLVFADNYPCKRGTKVRYQVMVVDPTTGEGTAMHYSNWLNIP